MAAVPSSSWTSRLPQSVLRPLSGQTPEGCRTDGGKPSAAVAFQTVTDQCGAAGTHIIFTDSSIHSRKHHDQHGLLLVSVIHHRTLKLWTFKVGTSDDFHYFSFSLKE